MNENNLHAALKVVNLNYCAGWTSKFFRVARCFVYIWNFFSSKYSEMLSRHSTKFLTITRRKMHIGRLLNQVEDKTVTAQTENLHGSFPSKIKNLSNSALARYNEIIGFAEIDQAYVKVTALQVRDNSQIAR